MRRVCILLGAGLLAWSAAAGEFLENKQTFARGIFQQTRLDQDGLIRLVPGATAGTFSTEIIDLGETNSARFTGWVAEQPPGTAVSVEYRSAAEPFDPAASVPAWRKAVNGAVPDADGGEKGEECTVPAGTAGFDPVAAGKVLRGKACSCEARRSQYDDALQRDAGKAVSRLLPAPLRRLRARSLHPAQCAREEDRRRLPVRSGRERNVSADAVRHADSGAVPPGGDIQQSHFVPPRRDPAGEGWPQEDGDAGSAPDGELL